MYERHSHNSNLFLLSDINHWDGFLVQAQCGPLIVSYLERIAETLNSAISEYPRVCAIRFDLRFPLGYCYQDTSVISRFIESLKAKLESEELHKKREGKRVYPCRLRYTWVKEQNESVHWHYHVCIFLNRDAYFTLGNFRHESDNVARGNMASRINDAWASALRIPSETGKGLVHFPRCSVYHINQHGQDGEKQYESLFYRLSYFAKANTKYYGDNSNSFGCSRK